MNLEQIGTVKTETNSLSNNLWKSAKIYDRNMLDFFIPRTWGSPGNSPCFKQGRKGPRKPSLSRHQSSLGFFTKVYPPPTWGFYLSSGLSGLERWLEGFDGNFLVVQTQTVSFSRQNVAGRQFFDVFGPWAYFFRQNVAGQRFWPYPVLTHGLSLKRLGLARRGLENGAGRFEA